MFNLFSILSKFKSSAQKEEQVPGFTLLTSSQIWGKNRLDVIAKFGPKVAATDMTNALGGLTSGSNERTTEGELSCKAWTASIENNKVINTIQLDGEKYLDLPNDRCISVRPVLPPWETAKITPTAVKKGINGIDVVEYGEYPQTFADKETGDKLEELFQHQSIEKTGKRYTFSATKIDEFTGIFIPAQYDEYEYENKKYIRVKAMTALRRGAYLSSGKHIEHGKTCWVRVEPIEWLKDPSGHWVSKKCLFANIPFGTKECEGDKFENSFIKRYLDTYFSEDIKPSVLMSEKIAQAQKEDAEKRAKAVKRINEQLTKATSPEAISKVVGVARTPGRKALAERIVKIRRARDILAAAAQKAQKDGNGDLLEEIIKIARPYSGRYAAILNKFNKKHMDRRGK